MYDADGSGNVSMHGLHHVHVRHLAGPLRCHQDAPEVLAAVREGDGGRLAAAALDYLPDDWVPTR